MINPTQQQVLETIQDGLEHQIDKEVNSNLLNPQVNINEEDKPYLAFHLERESEEVILPVDSAVSQFLNRIKVPVSFFKRCSNELKQAILNEHNKRHRSLLLRCRTEDDLTVCRAVLSTHFSRDKDDIHIYPPALESLGEIGTNLDYFNQDDLLTVLNASFDDCRIEQGETIVQGSLSVLNSETGHSSIWIYPTLTINGFNYANRRGDYSHNLHRIIHKGTLDISVLKRIIQETKDIAQVGIIQYLRAQEETVTSEHASNFIETIDDFPKRFSSILNNEWKEQEQIRKTQVMQQVMQMAQELPLFQQISVTRQVGRFIRLFENSTREQAEITQNIQEL